MRSTVSCPHAMRLCSLSFRAALPARLLLFMYAFHAGLGSCGFLRFVSL